MDLRQLQQFVTVAEELNFRRAAERLHMTQPPLTAAIQRLEEDLDVALLTRDRHRVLLTTAGEAFLREARRVLQGAKDARAAARTAAAGGHGLLRVSYVPSALFSLLPDVLTRFRAAYPAVKLALTRDLSARQLPALEQDKVDVAILIPSPELSAPHLEIRPLRREGFALACPVDHPLARRSQVRLRDVKPGETLPLFTLDHAPGYTGALLKASGDALSRDKFSDDDQLWAANLVLVSAGFGLAVVPDSMRAVQVKGIVYIRIVQDNDEPLDYPIAMAARRERRPIVDNFLRCMDGTLQPADLQR